MTGIVIDLEMQWRYHAFCTIPCPSMILTGITPVLIYHKHVRKEVDTVLGHVKGLQGIEQSEFRDNAFLNQH